MLWKGNEYSGRVELPDEINNILLSAPSVTLAKTADELTEFSYKDAVGGWHEVCYDIPGKGKVTEARVCKAKNGVAANYIEAYMRRRDPDSMLIGDSFPTDKKTYKEVYKKDFNDLRSETFNWLKGQKLMCFPFMGGAAKEGIPSFVIAPDNAGFFALALSILQGIINIDDCKEKFKPKVFMFIAPTFRHTHFNGKQIVVHNRLEENYEIFSYNLYPGPSAKKGVYGALIHYGEKEGWATAHASAVQVRTPYDNRVNIMHEGASGGGKSEMNEHMHRKFDGTIYLGKNLVTEEEKFIVLPRCCDLYAIADDMALCHSSFQKDNGKLAVKDAENGWFIRVDHINQYGTDPDIEICSIHPKSPLLFLNIDVQPNSTALLWEHIEDEKDVPCPNPRFVLPKANVEGAINKPVFIDIRSFGVRTPPCVKEKPTYGIIGLFHILPPALAWLWRLVSPRGHDNPSIVDKKGGMASEGVGSYWPFATGKKITQANLLLKQFNTTPNVLNVLCPVKHIGAWETGFMPQWIMREYLSRRGGKFYKRELARARCSLLGYSMKKIIVEGQNIRRALLNVEYQNEEVGLDAYDKGADILKSFFEKELKGFMSDELDPLGRKIIDCFFNGCGVEEYEALIPTESIFAEE